MAGRSIYGMNALVRGQSFEPPFLSASGSSHEPAPWTSRCVRSIVTHAYALALALSTLTVVASAHGEELDLQLVLAADVSRSMNHDELRLQREGYEAALRSKHVAWALSSGGRGRAALTYVEWAGVNEQLIVVPWTIVSSAADLQGFADMVSQGPRLRAMTSSTSLSSALQFVATLFDANGLSSFSRVIDVSGDGPNDAGPPIDAVRDLILAQGIVINGLSITLGDFEVYGTYAYLFGTGYQEMLQYYNRSVIGGPGAFTLAVGDMEGFAEAMERKLVLEIAGADLDQGGRLALLRE